MYLSFLNKSVIPLLSLYKYSINNKNKINIKNFIPDVSNFNSKSKNIFFIKEKDEVKSLLLKKTQEIVTKKNVDITPNDSLSEGKNEFCEITDERCFLLVLSKKEGIKRIEWNSPQKINVQFAPCHNPLTMKIIKIFRMDFKLPFLDPPIGM